MTQFDNSNCVLPPICHILSALHCYEAPAELYKENEQMYCIGMWKEPLLTAFLSKCRDGVIIITWFAKLITSTYSVPVHVYPLTWIYQKIVCTKSQEWADCWARDSSLILSYSESEHTGTGLFIVRGTPGRRWIFNTVWQNSSHQYNKFKVSNVDNYLDFWKTCKYVLTMAIGCHAPLNF